MKHNFKDAEDTALYKFNAKLDEFVKDIQEFRPQSLEELEEIRFKIQKLDSCVANTRPILRSTFRNDYRSDR